MGTQVLAADRSNTKPNYVLSTVAAGSVVSADFNLYLFVGSAIQTQLNGKTGQRMCMQALREESWPNEPISGDAFWASYDTATDTLLIGSGADPTLTEVMVAVIQASGFSAAGVSNSAHCKRMYELVLEDVLKVA
jgi:hypothetical protein